LEERLAGQARDDRERARSLPPGKEYLLGRARRIEEAAADDQMAQDAVIEA
jgi:hypothetical protein